MVYICIISQWFANLLNIVLDPLLIFGIGPFEGFGITGAAIAIRIIIFALLPSWGLSNAAATLVGQNLGAKQPKRAERSVWATAWINMILLALVGAVLMLFSDGFIRLFIDDLEVIAVGALGLRIISAGFIAYGLGMVMVNAFNGAGDTMTPTWINVFCFWLFEIPVAWLLAIPAGMNESGVFLAIVAAETVMTLLAWWLFRRGSWKKKVV